MSKGKKHCQPTAIRRVETLNGSMSYVDSAWSPEQWTAIRLAMLRYDDGGPVDLSLGALREVAGMDDLESMQQESYFNG